MNHYFAPMEGITGYVFRQVHHACFPGCDRYYAPFIAAGPLGNYKKKELKDVLPENNDQISLIPQVLTNDAKAMLMTQKLIKELGYTEVNLNLGCPAGTVFAKGRGSGFLKDLEGLDTFFEEVFEKTELPISVKTRLGVNHPEEFYQLIDLYNKYPIKELIIHPRVRQDFYKNQTNKVMFAEAVRLCHHTIGYNGDICSKEDYDEIVKQFPTINSVMIGRGMLKNPGLMTQMIQGTLISKEKLREFHDSLYEAYRAVLQEENNVVYKMKELWFYMINLFENHEKYGKKIKKVSHCKDYELIIGSMFEDLKLTTER